MTTTPLTQPTGNPGFLRQHLRLVLVMGTIGGLLIGTLLGLTVGPRSPSLGEASNGDQALIADVRSVLADDRGYQALSVARLRDGRAAYAGFGTADGQVPTPQTPFELGSVTKTFTGLLLADGVDRGEMALEDPLAKHLPELAGTPAGDITLIELATHSSGLPGLAPMGAGATLTLLGNQNPYAVSVDQLLQATRTIERRNPGRYAYSNLGMSLLGHAEARAAKAADWPTLARERLLTPLRMTNTTFVLSEDQIPGGTVRGHEHNGWPAAHWFGAAYAPAGSSTWTTAQDMARYAQAVLTQKAPGMAALTPEAEAGERRQIGLAWQFSEAEGRELAWHNGATGGFTSMLALDRERGQGVLMLSNSSRNADRAGLILAATQGSPPAVDRSDLPGLVELIGIVVALAFLVGFVSAALRGRDRLAVATGLLSGAIGLLLLVRYGPWDLAPAWIWAGLTGAAVGVAAYAVLRALNLPNLPAGRVRAVLGILNAVVSLILLGFVLYSL